MTPPLGFGAHGHGGTPRRREAARAKAFGRSAWPMTVALIVLALTVWLGSPAWSRAALFGIRPAKGTVIGLSLRTDRHIATFIQTLEPYVPSLHRNADKDRFRASLFLVPLDGSAPRLIRLRSGLRANAFGNARLLGSDGRTLWFSLAGLGGVDLERHTLRTEAELAGIDPRQLPRPWGGNPVPPEPRHFLAPGLMTSPSTWLGLYADAEVERELRPGKLFLPAADAVPLKRPRRLRLAQLQADPRTRTAQLIGLRTLGEAGYLNAAFLRPDRRGAPLRLADPPGALVLYTTATGLNASTGVARVDDAGQLRWRVDTGIERFTLQQILPGDTLTAFVGTRPAVPGQVSEPLLVLLEHGSGRLITHSLWQ
jgi:hypothetical protein